MPLQIGAEAPDFQPDTTEIIAGSVSNERAQQIFGEWEAPRPYIRIVPQPNGS